MFWEGLDAFCSLAQAPPQSQSKAMKDVIKRSCFLETSVQQCAEAFESVNYQVDPTVQAHILNKFSGMVSSQAAEDSFHRMKNAKLVKGKKRFRRPQKCMASVLATSMLSTVHRFEEIETSSAKECKSE